MSHPNRGFLAPKWGTHHFWEIHICGAAPLSINAILPICEGLVAARMTLRAVVNTSHPHIPETHQEKMSLHYNDRFIDDDIKLYKHQHGAALFLMAASIANHFSSNIQHAKH